MSKRGTKDVEMDWIIFSQFKDTERYAWNFEPSLSELNKMFCLCSSVQMYLPQPQAITSLYKIGHFWKHGYACLEVCNLISFCSEQHSDAPCIVFLFQNECFNIIAQAICFIIINCDVGLASQQDCFYRWVKEDRSWPKLSEDLQ